MLRKNLLTLLTSLSLCGLLLAGPAWAEEDDELDDLDEDDFDEDLDPDADDAETYEDYKEELRGESPSEEIDAWERYLEAYPASQFSMEIRQRMKSLEDAAFEELQGDTYLDDRPGNEVDAKRREMQVYEPMLIGMNPNTRRRFEFGLLWGYNDYINYDLAVEWAFRRNLSVFGGLRHEGRSFGGSLQAGVKYAFLKDVRTGIVLTGAFSIKAGYSSLDRLSFTIEPWIGFAWLASDKIQVQTSLAFDLRVDKGLHWVTWDAMVVFNPKPKIGIYIESKQKHSLHDVEGLDTQYLAFYQAGVGAKFRPSDKMEFGIGANIPYFWRIWKDYNYVGIHANAVFFFGGAPEK
jgi:hypothetical protein